MAEAAAITKTTAIKSTKTAGEIRKYVNKMYTRAHEAKAQGRPVAWVMFGVHGPILRAMDITPVYTENYAGLCAAKRYEGVLIEKAESEGYLRVAEGFSAANILAGMHIAVASKIDNLVCRVGLTQESAITGGGAKDIGLVKAIEEKLGINLWVPDDPQLTGAIGAAVLAGELARQEA